MRDAISDVEGAARTACSPSTTHRAGSTGTGEGFYSDGSFLQHYKHPYNGGYGKELLGTLSSLLYLLGGTEWSVTDPDLDNIYGWIDDAFDPLIARGDLMGSVCGREIARPSKQNHAPTQTVIEGALRLIPAARPDRAARLTALVKQWITEDTFRDFLTVTDPASLVAARAVLASGRRRAARSSLHKQYPRMDKVAHHRPGIHDRAQRVLVADLQLRVDPDREPARLAPVRRHGPDVRPLATKASWPATSTRSPT